MSEIRRIRGMLRSVCRGPAWHGPSISENLEGIAAIQAASHPIPGAHSIWEIVHHVIAWEREVVGFLAGKPHVTTRGEDDLEKIVPGRDFPWSVVLHGIVHHSLYHSGQIAMLKKIR
jgi:hypothetical protein